MVELLKHDPDKECKTQADYEADLEALKPYTSIVRTYSAVDGGNPDKPCQVAQYILPAAVDKKIKVILGMWYDESLALDAYCPTELMIGIRPDTPESFQNDLDALKQYIPRSRDAVYAVTVGSETLYRGNFTGPELLQHINTVKQALPGVKVGTADSWNKYQDGTADALITGGVELLSGLPA